MEINTFVDLYDFLKNYNGDIINWLQHPWKGKDKQESLLRLFSKLKCVKKLEDFDICGGNYNLKTIKKYENYREMFYDEKNNPIYLKDSGDSSDLTGINKQDDKHILITTSKNVNKLNINKLDIEKILYQFESYKEANFKYTLCVCIPELENYNGMKANIRKTSKKLLKILNKDVLVVDWNDLKNSFYNFKKIYKNIEINEIIKVNNVEVLNFQFHQRLSIYKTIKLKKKNVKSILFGHIQRSGKSYIIAGSIALDNKNNYLFITTAPNETIAQQMNVFNCFQLREYAIHYIHGDNKDVKLSDKNIIICSKQYLQNKNIKWLEDIDFDMRFIDESHQGGTTELSREILNTYGKESCTVYVTATYNKPVNVVGIPKKHQILWDLEDIKFCKNGEFGKLTKKHGKYTKRILKEYDEDEIINTYEDYPELHILTHRISKETVESIKNDFHYGWSLSSCFNLNKKETRFQNEKANVNMWKSIFGYKDKHDIPDKEYPPGSSYIDRINKICKDKNANSDDPVVIMCFMQPNNIDKISKLTKKLLIKYDIIPEFEILRINSKITNNPKKEIEEARQKAKNTNKKGVLVLSGKQCTLGVTIHNCDVVLLMNNITSFDMIYQMMFRCMTPRKEKKHGFVIDLDIHRAINTIVTCSMLIKNDMYPKESVKYSLESRLVNLNYDEYHVEDDTKMFTEFSDNIYDIYSSNIENTLKTHLDHLTNKHIFVNKEDQIEIENLFKHVKTTSLFKKNKHLEFKSQDDVEVGEVLGNQKESEQKERKDINEEKKFNFMKIIKHIIPIICVLTIKHNESNFVKMCSIIEKDNDLNTIFSGVINITNINFSTIKIISTMYEKYVKDNNMIDVTIADIKRLFTFSCSNGGKLANLVKQYLIPTEKEKRDNAEVSTPDNIRKEMLDTLELRDKTFWNSPKMILEPSAGKGLFLYDIYCRFDVGLKKMYPDENERKRVILEECIFFADINELNIFICKLMLDPEDKYDLNSYCGDSLQMDVEEIWDIAYFDLIVGNPPYNEPFNEFSKTSIPLYNKFIEKFVDITRFLLFIVPSRWFAGGRGLNNFRNMMLNREDIYLIKHYNNSKDIFDKVDIKGGVNYFLIDNEYSGKTTFIDNEDINVNSPYKGYKIKLNEHDIVVNPKYNSLIQLYEQFGNLDSLYKPTSYYGIKTNDKRLMSEDDLENKELSKHDKNILKCYVSKQKGFVKYIHIDDVSAAADIDTWKVMTVRAAGKGSDGFGNMFIGVPGEVCSQSYIFFEVQNKKEALSLLSYLRCKLPNVMLSLRKISQDISKETIKWIPIIPLDRTWNNDSVNKYFELTKKEIRLIEETKLDGYRD